MHDDGDGWCGRTKRNARFEPKQINTIRECMLPYIGQVFKFRYAGHSDDDEDFSGQSRWIIDISEEYRLSDEAKGRWFPSEDLIDVVLNETTQNN